MTKVVAGIVESEAGGHIHHISQPDGSQFGWQHHQVQDNRTITARLNDLCVALIT